MSTRWLAVDDFEAGDEPNPYPADEPVVMCSVRAIPIATYHWWALGAFPLLASAANRRRRARRGQAWVPEAALDRDRRRTRALVVLGALDVLALLLAAADSSIAALLVPVLTAVLGVALVGLRWFRVGAVLDERTGHVGIHGLPVHPRTVRELSEGPLD